MHNLNAPMMSPAQCVTILIYLQIAYKTIMPGQTVIGAGLNGMH